MYDAVFIGGGLNYAGAVVLAKKGMKVALIEKDLKHFGGVCLHNGCIPSKNLLHRTKTVHESKEDVFDAQAKLNLEKVQEKIASFIEKTTNSVINQTKLAGVELIEGEGTVTDENRVEVNGKTLETKYIIVGTGSRPRIPEGIEYDGEKIVTSNEIIRLKEFPKEISIYGSGAIGLEMANFLAINGVKVNLIYRHEHISRKFAPEILPAVENQLKSIGINLVPNTSVNTAKVVNGTVVMQTQNGEMKTPMLLVATGRVPNTECVKTGDDITKADDYFQVTNSIFAIGDCNKKLLLAHAARAEVLNVCDNITGNRWKLNLDNIPKFIYTIPLSYAVVGRVTGNKAVFGLNHLGIQMAVPGSENGKVILYFDDENFVVGGEIFAPNAEELIGIITTAITGEMDIRVFDKVTFPHPTFSEAIDRALRRKK